jgi:predicted acylesterase/phospholipase RssA
VSKNKFEGVGLALAGGGWRAFSQIAVLESMEQNDIKIGAVAGTSMGALIATLVAAGLESPEIKRLALKLDQSVVDTGVMKASAGGVLNVLKNQGMIDYHAMIDTIRPILDEAGVHKMSDIEKPLAMATVDLLSGDLIVFANQEGVFEGEPGSWTTLVGDYDVATCVAASAAYPLMVTPVEFLDYVFVDGGCRMNFPTALFDRDQFDAVVGVDMMREFEPLDNPGTLSVMKRCLDAGSQQLEKLYATACDVRVNIHVPDADTFAAGTAQDVIDMGERYVAEHPIDWSQTRPGFFDAIRRAAAAHASRIIRASAPVGEARKVPAESDEA